MRKVEVFNILILALLLGAQLSFAQDWGVIRYAKTKANIRANRSTNSQVVGQLKFGQKVKADFLKNNWYAVFNQHETIRDENKAIGYIYAPLLIPNPPSETRTAGNASGILKYRVVAHQDVSYRGTPRMVCRVVLETIRKPSKDTMIKTAQHIWQKCNKGGKEFTVFMYLPGMDTNFSAYGVGEFRLNGMKEFKINKFTLLDTNWE